jgi:hypothetical protein
LDIKIENGVETVFFQLPIVELFFKDIGGIVKFVYVVELNYDLRLRYTRTKYQFVEVNKKTCIKVYFKGLLEYVTGTFYGIGNSDGRILVRWFKVIED